MQESKVTEKDVLELAQALPKEQAPSRDLWPGIEQAINKAPQQQRETNSNWYMKVAAAVLPVALVAGLYMNQATQTDVDAPWLQPVVASFELQKQQALRQVSQQTPVLENWKMSLEELEQAEQSLKQALRNQPDDPALMKMLTQVYQQQINLIEKAHRPQYQQI